MEAALGIMMRVPGLFIIDYWWQHDRNKSLPHSMETGEILNCVLTNLGTYLLEYTQKSNLTNK